MLSKKPVIEMFIRSDGVAKSSLCKSIIKIYFMGSGDAFFCLMHTFLVVNGISLLKRSAI